MLNYLPSSWGNDLWTFTCSLGLQFYLFYVNKRWRMQSLEGRLGSIQMMPGNWVQLLNMLENMAKLVCKPLTLVAPSSHGISEHQSLWGSCERCTSRLYHMPTESSSLCTKYPQILKAPQVIPTKVDELHCHSKCDPQTSDCTAWCPLEIQHLKLLPRLVAQNLHFNMILRGIHV